MCTAVAINDCGFYFGRTLDYDFSYPSQVVLTPRSFPLRLLRSEPMCRHYAILGMAYVRDGYPLYFDGVNEEGLCMAGLNFEGNAHYEKEAFGKENIAAFEIVPYVLGTCRNIYEARHLLLRVNITDDCFCVDLPSAPLHFMISDKNGSLVLEATDEGIKLYDNPVGVLTNNPPLPFQLQNLENYMNLSPYPAKNRFSEKLRLSEYSRGMGALGLPGDFSSMSRFVRSAFVKLNSERADGEIQNVSRFFALMNTVNVPKGACRLENEKSEETLYTCCMSAERGVYYYTTKECRRICAVDMKRVDKRGSSLICYPLSLKEDVLLQN